jgi:hypothetical protein
MALLKKNYFFFTSFLALIVLLAAFLNFLILTEIQKKSQAFFSGKERIVSLLQGEENRKEIENLYKNYQPDFDKIDKVFVETEAPIEFINFLEKTASSSSLSFKIVSLTKKMDKNTPWPSITFQLSAQGSFPNFLKFLEKLENSPYLIETTDLNVTAPTQKGAKLKEFASLPPTETGVLFTITVLSR